MKANRDKHLKQIADNERDAAAAGSLDAATNGQFFDQAGKRIVQGTKNSVKSIENQAKALVDKADKNQGASDIAAKFNALAKKAGVKTNVRGSHVVGAGAVGATVLSGMLLYGAYKTFQRFYSKAAKACAGKSGSDKSACMREYKMSALKAQMNDLQKALAACGKSKNPKKCSKTVSAKIMKIRKQIAKL